MRCCVCLFLAVCLLRSWFFDVRGSQQGWHDKGGEIAACSAVTASCECGPHSCQATARIASALLRKAGGSDFGTSGWRICVSSRSAPSRLAAMCAIASQSVALICPQLPTSHRALSRNRKIRPNKIPLDEESLLCILYMKVL